MFKNRLTTAEKIILGLWVALPVLNWSIDFFKDRYNNYKTFTRMFWHLVEQKNLYAAYPLEHFDFFHYGPVFSLVIAPFAILPNVLGVLLWGIFNVLILYYALNQLKLKPELKFLLMLLCTIELGNSLWSQQSNPWTAAMIILTFTCVEDEKDFQAPLWCLLAAFTKIYGIVGMIFFLFSKNKKRFIAGCFVWSAVLIVLPMLLSSPQFIVQSYVDWYHDLINKNSELIVSISSDLSVMGLFRKVSGHLEWSNTWFFAIGLPLLLLPLLRFTQYSSKHFRVLILASLLMFVVLFSTAAEHPTYIICVFGLFLWILTQANVFTLRNSMLIFFVLVLTGLAPTYVFSKAVAQFVLSYALKALPCLIVWILLVKDLLIHDFSKESDSDFFIQKEGASVLVSSSKPIPN